MWLDVNDNQPVFENLPYSTNIREDVLVGDVVFIPTVSDRDSFSNAELFFTITAGNADGHFSINESTGAITTLQTLDRETREIFQLRVHVRDNGDSRMYADTMVQIAVEDVNDNHPVFSPTVSKASVKENTDCSNNVVVRLTATDSDLCSSGTKCITFSLDSERINHAFILRGDQILCNSTFDRELQKRVCIDSHCY